MSEEWLTTEEAAGLSGYHVNHIRRLLRSGEIAGRKWGQAWQVSKASLLSYLEAAKKLGDKRWGPKP
jgi:excisionase family DNA binding protein